MNKKSVLITGASGLLGQALVKESLNFDFSVYAHYNSNPQPDTHHCRWLQGDFSTITGIQQFCIKYQRELKRCTHLINNYGPINLKVTKKLESSDYISEFHQNVIPAVEITRFCLGHPTLKSVIFLGFEFLGKDKSYKKILPYAIAKNSLLQICMSYAECYKNICFNIVSPVTLAGAAVPLRNGLQVTPSHVARQIIEIMTNGATGGHFVIQ